MTSSGREVNRAMAGTCNTPMSTNVKSKYTFDFATFVTPDVTCQMSAETSLLLTELASSFTECFDVDIAETYSKNPSFNKICSHSELSIKLMVQMLSRLSTFKTFTTDDQIRLLKNSIIEMFILLSIRAYDVTTGGFNIRQANGYHYMSMDSLKTLHVGVELLTSYHEFAVDVLRCIQRDGTILMCLMLLLFFSKKDEQSDVAFQHPSRVEKCYQLYKNTLANYLAVKYPHSDVITLESVMNLSYKMTGTCVKWREALMACTIQELSPLVAEICEISEKKAAN